MKEIDNTFYNDIRTILQQARNKAYSAINSAMVEAYWSIGKRIVEEEQKGKGRAEYGANLIKNLSIALNVEFGKGFSIANLKNFRQFYLTFKDDQKGYTLCSQLSWSHIRLIMRIDKPNIREYYLKETKAQGWSVRQLQRNINSHYYERLLSSIDKKSDLISVKNIEQENTRDFIKDPYVLEFLNLPENEELKESTLEKNIINNLQAFLLEVGKGFSFVARQFRISTETSHFYIDLVFYNYILKCFVIIDLKTGKLTHQNIGQMDMYVRMFDDLKRSEDDNPTIGIILCSDKEDTVVRYSILKDSEQLFASKYRLVLPTEEELKAELEREIKLIEEQQAGNEK
ncbi:MAG: PDDEXK nuclease domain-containing protein [Candidatus Scalindua sp.]